MGCSGTEAGSYWRLIDSCITQRKAQGPSRTCNKGKEDKEEGWVAMPGQWDAVGWGGFFFFFISLEPRVD